jgi:hypothetical protein
MGDIGPKPIHRSLAVLSLLMVLMVGTRARADQLARSSAGHGVALDSGRAAANVRN